MIRRVLTLRRAAGLALALVLLVTAACAGDGRDEFAEDVRATRNDVDATLEQMAAATTNDELIDRLRTASENIALAADRMSETDPPDELRDERDELEVSYRALSDEVGATAEALEDLVDQDTSPIEGINFRNWSRTQRALAALRREGIDVPPLQRY
jgi:hypothetical protein